MYNSQYYTCEQIDERLLQGYLDDYNSQTGQSLTKAQFLTKLGNIFSKEGVIDNIATQIGYYECDTAAGTAAKVITVANYALFAGGSMKVKFANKNTANNATLNINSQGAKALYYQGERASATNSWDAEEVVEIYYDGTSYYANNVKGGSGSGVYDVSKEHPTSGPNSDGKFTLEYILNPSNVNELIPVNKRYPGMSIQFVSTDNNYVKFFCNSQNFTTDVTQWQGVDEELIAGSHNPVEGGVVAAKMIDLNSFKGTIKNNNTFLFDNSNVAIGDVIYYSFTTNSGQTGCIRLYDSSDNILDTIGKISTSTTQDSWNGVFTIPSGFAYAKALTNGTFVINKLYSEHSFLAHKDDVNLLEIGYLKYDLVEKGSYGGSVGEVVSYNPSLDRFCLKIDIQPLKVGDVVYLYGRINDRIITATIDGVIKRVITDFTQLPSLQPITLEQDEDFLYISCNTGIQPYIKFPNAACVLYSHIDYIEKLCNEYAEKKDDEKADFIYIFTSEKVVTNNQVAFMPSNYAKVGDIIYYSVEAEASGICSIELLDSNNTRLGIYGIIATSGARIAEGSFTIPNNFAKAIFMATDGKIATCHYLKSENNIQTIKEDLDLVTYRNSKLYDFVGYEDGLYEETKYDSYRYIPITPLTDDDITYAIEILFLDSTVESNINISVKNTNTSSSSDTVRIGTITAEEIANHTKKRFTFKKLQGVTANYLCLENIGTNKSVKMYYSVDSGVNAKINTLKTYTEENINKLTEGIKSIPANLYCLIQEQICQNNQELFGITNYTSIGDKLYYDVESVSGGTAFIELLDANNSRLAVYGVTGSQSSVQHASGSFVIPENFAKARIGAGNNKTATIHYLKSIKNIQTIREDLDAVTESNSSLSKFVGYTENTDEFTVGYGGWVYILVENIFTEDGINYTVELQILSDITISNAITVKIVKNFSSSDTDTKLLGYIYPEDVTNHTKKRFTFTRLDGVDVNYIRLNSSSLVYNSKLKVHYVLDSGVNAIVNTTKERFDNEEWFQRANLDNRLANPLFTSFAKYNEEHPTAQIADEIVMVNGNGISELRIPISEISNVGTTLIAATASASGPVEHGKTSIDVARKVDGGESWSVQRVFDYRQYGQFWNLSFVVDRTGVHGVAGRIYLFSACGISDATESFDPDNYTPVGASAISYAKADLLYSYSDDDGVTWSTPASLKSLWSADDYNMVTPAPNTGIQLTDGTLVIPLFCLKDGVRYSGIMYKKPNENWAISNHVPTTYNQGNECVAVEVETNTPYLYIRNENIANYTIDKKNYIQGMGDQIYKYSFTDDSWAKIDSTYNPNIPCQFSIIKCTLNGTTLYLRSAIDTNRSARINITIWGSLDCKKWIRIYRVYSPGGVGYSSVYEYDGKIVVSYESNGNRINCQTITEIIPIILNSVRYYIDTNISVQDRLQMIFNQLNGIQ